MSGVKKTWEVILTSDNTGESCSATTWDPSTGTLLSIYKHATALGRDTLQVLGNSYLVGADATKPRLHVWPLNSQRPVPNLKLNTPGKVSVLRCTPNGSYIVAAVGEKLYIWQTSSGRLVSSINRHYQTVTCLAFTHDSAYFASAGEDGLIFVWSLYRCLNEQNPTPIHSLSDHTLPVQGLYFGSCGSMARLCSVSLDRTTIVYDLNSGRVLLILIHNVPLSSVCMNKEENRLFIGCTNGSIYNFDLHDPPRGTEHYVGSRVEVDQENDQTAIFRGHESSVVALSVSMDSRILLSASNDTKVHLWDIASGQILRTINHKGPVIAAFFAKNYENFRANELKPSLVLHDLQRVSDNAARESVIEVVKRDWDPRTILNFDSFVESGVDHHQDPEESMARKLENAMEEIERLKKINATMYRFSVEQIVGKTNESL